MSEKPPPERIPMRPERLLAFSDAVLAVIITLMILEIKLPHIPEHATGREVWHGFAEVLPHLFAYLLSFAVLALFWINHHSLFHTVKRVDPNLLWHNCVVLFWASLVPFATAFLGEHYQMPEATLFYGSVQLLILLSSAWMVAYMFRKGLIDEALSPAVRKHYTRLNGLALGLTVISIPLGYVSTWIAISLYLVVILLYVVPKPLDVRRTEE
ncbi:MAG: DUF1211 domain-containing protein [Flavobacteriales bacterium]|nr:DUF1211 domain-containing protein [Flavobacteriales bacterium]MBP6695983.1 DUF1211 domain-containing protein [Flavobacteriales bacterium]